MQNVSSTHGFGEPRADAGNWPLLDLTPSRKGNTTETATESGGQGSGGGRDAWMEHIIQPNPHRRHRLVLLSISTNFHSKVLGKRWSSLGDMVL